MDQQAAQMAQAEKVCNYKFKDRNILCEAIQAAGSGVTQSGSRAFPEGNKRLAVLGKSNIKTLLNKQSYNDGLTRGRESEKTHHTQSNYLAGEMNDRLKAIEDNANLASVGKAHQFKDIINGNPAQRGKISPGLYQDTVEALVSGAQLDGGDPAAITVMTALGLL